MPRVRSPERDKAKELYIQHNGEITNREIASQLNIDEKKVAVWKQRDNWDNTSKKNNVVQQKSKSCTTKKNNNKKSTSKEEKEPISQAVKELMKNEKLTDKQRLFCIYYSKCFNATKAYLKAYECDYITANSNASKLMVKTSIKAMIDQLTQVTINKEVLKRSLLQKYIDIAFSDIKEYMEFGTETIEGKNGDFELSVVKLKDSNGVDGTLISEVSQGKDGIKIKMLDKMKAMDFLSKHTNLLSDEEKTKLDIEYKRIQNEKLKAEVAKVTGNDEPQIESDGFIEALNGKTAEVWNDETEN